MRLPVRRLLRSLGIRALTWEWPSAAAKDRRSPQPFQPAVCDAIAFEPTDVVKTLLVVHACRQRFDIEVKGYTILVEILQSKVRTVLLQYPIYVCSSSKGMSVSSDRRGVPHERPKALPHRL